MCRLLLLLLLSWCFRSTIRLISDGEPRTASSTFTQLLSSLIFFSVALRPRKPKGLLGTGRRAQDGHFDFHTAPELSHLLQCCSTSTEAIRLIRDGEPRTASSTFTQLLSSVAAPCLFTQTHIFHSRVCEATPVTQPEFSKVALEYSKRNMWAGIIQLAN